MDLEIWLVGTTREVDAALTALRAATTITAASPRNRCTGRIRVASAAMYRSARCPAPLSPPWRPGARPDMRTGGLRMSGEPVSRAQGPSWVNHACLNGHAVFANHGLSYVCPII
jgi:hypothetical protein